MINKPYYFYDFFVKNLIKHNQDMLSNASIKIDGSGGKDFRRALTASLRKEIGLDKISKFKFIDSKKDNLIQLADMVVGAIARSYSDDQRKDAHHWLDLLKKKKKIKNTDIWEFR